MATHGVSLVPLDVEEEGLDHEGESDSPSALEGIEEKQKRNKNRNHDETAAQTISHPTGILNSLVVDQHGAFEIRLVSFQDLAADMILGMSVHEDNLVPPSQHHPQTAGAAWKQDIQAAFAGAQRCVSVGEVCHGGLGEQAGVQAGDVVCMPVTAANVVAGTITGRWILSDRFSSLSSLQGRNPCEFYIARRTKQVASVQGLSLAAFYPVPPSLTSPPVGSLRNAPPAVDLLVRDGKNDSGGMVDGALSNQETLESERGLLNCLVDTQGAFDIHMVSFQGLSDGVKLGMALSTFGPKNSQPLAEASSQWKREIARAFSRKHQGVVIVKIVPKGFGEQAGIQTGDVVCLPNRVAGTVGGSTTWRLAPGGYVLHVTRQRIPCKFYIARLNEEAAARQRPDRADFHQVVPS